MIHEKKLTKSVTMVWSDADVPWKCNGLVIRGDDEAILVDCNYKETEINQLLESIAVPVTMYLVSHMHLDHVNNLHEWSGHDIPLLCPIPEDSYLRDFNNLLKYSGSTGYGTDEEMKVFTFKIQGFREIKEIKGYQPGSTFKIKGVTVESIHLPGHSPGHCGFIIKDERGTLMEKVLFTSDLGLDSFGPWYGFEYCSLSDYRQSISMLRDIYSEGDYILAGSHNEPVFGNTGAPMIDLIDEKINSNEQRLLEYISENKEFSLDDILLTGLYYSRSSMDKMNDLVRKLYRFWEYFALKNHLTDMAERGVINNEVLSA